MLTVLTQTPLLREVAQMASHRCRGLAVSSTGWPTMKRTVQAL